MFEPAVGIRPGRPTFAPSVLTVARQIPGTEQGASPALRWGTGLSSRVRTCNRVFEWPSCPIPGHPDKCNPPVEALVEWPSFLIEQFKQCAGVLPDDEAVLAGELADEIRAGTAAAIARQLWVGIETDGAPSLVNTAVDLSAGGTIVSSMVGGVGALLAAYEATSDTGFPVLHVPASLLSAGENANLFAREGAVLMGASGTYLVSPGPAYPGSLGPLDTQPIPEPIPAPAGAAWLFISGPVEYAVSEPRIVVEQSDRRTNLWSARGQRQALVRIDPCSVFAVLVGLNG